MLQRWQVKLPGSRLPGRHGRKAYWLFCGALFDCVVEDPLLAWPDEDGCSVELEDDELELGALGVAELPADELGLEGAVLDDELELGELGVVTLPDTELELERSRLLLLRSPEADPEVAPELAPRLASPAGRSQP
jgi:hypothetical protein